MKTLARATLIFALIAAAANLAQAKRSAPKDVPPITRNGVTYSTPHDHIGFVIAKDDKTGNVLWSKQIYVVKYDPELERDVQDCFITELRIEGDNFIVSNEKDGQFELNPATLSVKVLKGEEVIGKKNK